MSRSGVDPRFVFRPATQEDADAVVAVIAASEQADNGEVDIALEDMVSDWARPSFDLEADTMVVTDGPDVVAYADEFRQRAFVHVHPRVRGQGIGTALLAWTEERARAHGEQLVGQTLSDTETAARELLRAHGYEVRWDTWVFQMELDDGSPAAQSPLPDVTLRPLRRPDDDRALYEVINTAFNEWPDRDPAEPLADWVAAHLDRPDTDPEMILVLDDGTDLIGAALCLRYEDEGWVDMLAVDRAHRGKGLATWLLSAAFAEFQRRGLRTAGLSTDSRTGARELYERVGMQVTRSYARFGKQLA